MPGSKARSSTVVGGGGRGRGTGREGLELRRRGSGKWKKTHGFSRRRGLVDRFQLSSFETARERQRDPFIYTRVGIRRAATRFILYHIERGEGGKDCVNDDERKRESEREKKRDF